MFTHLIDRTLIRPWVRYGVGRWSPSSGLAATRWSPPPLWPNGVLELAGRRGVSQQRAGAGRVVVEVVASAGPNA